MPSHALISVSEIADALPQMMLIARAGTPASSRHLPMSQAVTGVSSDGLTTMEHPAASAGAIFCIGPQAGKFHGAMMATGPTGRCCTVSEMLGTRGGTRRP